MSVARVKGFTPENVKMYYPQEIENWLRENKLSTVLPYAVASIFYKAYKRAATMETACNGF